MGRFSRQKKTQTVKELTEEEEMAVLDEYGEIQRQLRQLEARKEELKPYMEAIHAKHGKRIKGTMHEAIQIRQTRTRTDLKALSRDVDLTPYQEEYEVVFSRII